MGEELAHYPADELCLLCRGEDAFPEQGVPHYLHYNPYITIREIPLATYDYVVRGKSAIEWVMERYAVTVECKSGIKNDPSNISFLFLQSELRDLFRERYNGTIHGSFSLLLYFLF